MKKLLFLAAAAFALFSCQKDDTGREPLEPGERRISFQVKRPNAGKHIVDTKDQTYAEVADDLAIMDESKVAFLGVFVFGEDPNASPTTEGTDRYILQGTYGYGTDIPGGVNETSPPNFSGFSSAFPINNIKVQGGGIKHFYFVANADINPGIGVTTETEMLTMLTDHLPTITFDTLAKIKVVAPGIPMSAYVEVDCGVDPIEFPDEAQDVSAGIVMLERAVARFDIVNSTLDRYVTGAQVVAFDKGYIFDTLNALLQPAGKIYTPVPFALDGSGTHAIAELNTTLMARSYDYVLDYLHIGGIHPYEKVSFASKDPLLPGMVSAILTDWTDQGSAIVPDANITPIAGGYIFPSPGRRDSTVHVRLEMRKFDTVSRLADGTPNPNHLAILPGENPEYVTVPFIRDESGVTTYVPVARNHVYTLNVLQRGELHGMMMQVEDWRQVPANLAVHLQLPDTVEFYDGPNEFNVNWNSGTQKYEAIYNVPESIYTIRINTGGFTPTMNGGVGAGAFALPEGIEFLSADSQTVLHSKTVNPFKPDNAGRYNDDIFYVANPDAVLTGAKPDWRFNIKLLPNFNVQDRNTTFAVTLLTGDEIKQGNPTSFIHITQRGFGNFKRVDKANSYFAPTGTRIAIPVAQANADYETRDALGVTAGVTAPRVGVNDKIAAFVYWTDVFPNPEPSKNRVIDTVYVAGIGAGAYINVTRGNVNGNATIALYKIADDGGNNDPSDDVYYDGTDPDALPDVIWSWHIWGTDYNPDTALDDAENSPTDGAFAAQNGRIYRYTPPASAVTTQSELIQTNIFMDRNLGALNAIPANPDAAGLLYQWGRKDPFPGSVNFAAGTATMRQLWIFSPVTKTFTPITDGTGAGQFRGAPYQVAIGNAPANHQTPGGNNLNAAITQPLLFITNAATPYDWYANTAGAQNNKLWGDDGDVRPNYPSGAEAGYPKSAYDPCPPGWRVPIHGAWNGLANTNTNDRAIAWSATYKGRFGTINPAGTAGPEPWSIGGMIGGISYPTVTDFTDPATGPGGSAPAGYYPATGNRRNDTGTMYVVGEYGHRWSSTFYAATPIYATYFFIDVTRVIPAFNANRSSGLGVRCLQE